MYSTEYTTATYHHGEHDNTPYPYSTMTHRLLGLQANGLYLGAYPNWGFVLSLESRIESRGDYGHFRAFQCEAHHRTSGEVWDC